MIASFKMSTVLIFVCAIASTIQQTTTTEFSANETFNTENLSVSEQNTQQNITNINTENVSVSKQTTQQNITTDTENNFDFLDTLEFVDPADSVQQSYEDEERADNAEEDNGRPVVKTNATFAEKRVAVKKCVPRAACYKHEECGKGPRGGARCVGIFVGKCDCTACVSGLPCSSEATCGGLKNSCNNTTGICDCIKAHKANGFANFGQALLRFCNHEECDEESDTCFGLPCRRGRCVCL